MAYARFKDCALSKSCSASQCSVLQTQEDGESPSKDAIVRPGTPDAYLECHVSPCSLSVSDAPSHTLELDQAGLEDAAITLTGLNGSSIGKHGTGMAPSASHSDSDSGLRLWCTAGPCYFYGGHSSHRCCPCMSLE